MTICIQFFSGRGQNVPAVYALDSTFPENWNENVLAPAADILMAITEARTISLIIIKRTLLTLVLVRNFTKFAIQMQSS